MKKLKEVPKIDAEKDWLTTCSIEDMESCLESCIEEDNQRGEENKIIEEFNKLEAVKQHKYYKEEKLRKVYALVEEVFSKIIEYGDEGFMPTAVTIETDKLEIKIISK